ncbi:hypothetical protein ACFPFQ_47835, partial [Pseudonocardia sp. GCM10023141]
MKNVTGALVAVLAAVAMAATACGSSTPPAPAATGAGCISGFDAATDYFPVKAAFEHASNVTLTYERSYQVLRVKQPYPQSRSVSGRGCWSRILLRRVVAG